MCACITEDQSRVSQLRERRGHCYYFAVAIFRLSVLVMYTAYDVISAYMVHNNILRATQFRCEFCVVSVRQEPKFIGTFSTEQLYGFDVVDVIGNTNTFILASARVAPSAVG